MNIIYAMIIFKKHKKYILFEINIISIKKNIIYIKIT